MPGKLFVNRHVYPKYACSCCKDGVTSAPTVCNPIEGGLAGPGLLAFVVVNKFSDHLPLYRQQDVLARHGIFLSRSTLCGWLAQCAQLFRPLVSLIRQRSRPVAGDQRRRDAGARAGSHAGFHPDWILLDLHRRPAIIATPSMTTRIRAAATGRRSSSRISKVISKPMPMRRTNR